MKTMILLKNGRSRLVLSLTAMAALTGVASATNFTLSSPTSGGTLPMGVTNVGGIVLDAIGLNGNRVVAQLSAASLFVGQPNTTPITIGTQTGLNGAITSQLGGGFSEIAVRISLFDGDTGSGNFDEDLNSLLLNGIDFGNWSDVQAQNTNGDGTTGFSFSNGGFRNNLLDTGFFFSNDAAKLASLFTTITASTTLAYQLKDVDPGDNYFDFTQGVDGGLINTGTAPVVTPPTNSVPEGGSLGLAFLLTLAGMFAAKSRTGRGN